MIEQTFKFVHRNEFNPSDYPIGTQVIMLSSNGKYMLGKIRFIPSIKSVDVSGDSHAEYFAPII